MKKITVTIAQIRSMPRPASYEAELAACALERDNEHMTFDTESECFQALKQKYASYKPTAKDLARVNAFNFTSSPGQSSSSPRARCGGCGGRAIVK
jgi:hypothetical protein